MKYRVIGWTYLGNRMYPMHRGFGAGVEKAIVEDIRAHGYRFGGDMHEEYCPVLNDGTYVSYSWRGWGGIMAHAWRQESGKCPYMRYYMNMFIPEEDRVYPELKVDDTRIEPRTKRLDVHKMHLAEAPFQAIKEGTKTVELRLFDAKRRKIDVGDRIEFTSLASGEKITVDVVDLFVAKNFLELFSSPAYGSGDGLLFPPEAVGSPQGTTPEEMAEAMHAYYSAEEEKKRGVVAITLRKITHSMRTYLNICLEDLSDDEISEITPEWYVKFPRYSTKICYRIGENDEYDPDLNVMLRKTLEGVMGKEELLRALIEKNGAEIYLVAVPEIIWDCEDPRPMLSLDADIVEFLYKSGARIDLDYYIIERKNA